MVSGGGELAGVSVMVRDFGFRPDCGCLSLVTLISMVSKSHSFCHLPAHQSPHYTFSLSLSFTIYRGNVIFPQGCCTGYIKLMKCQLTVTGRGCPFGLTQAGTASPSHLSQTHLALGGILTHFGLIGLGKLWGVVILIHNFNVDLHDGFFARGSPCRRKDSSLQWI